MRLYQRIKHRQPEATSGLFEINWSLLFNVGITEDIQIRAFSYSGDSDDWFHSLIVLLEFVQYVRTNDAIVLMENVPTDKQLTSSSNAREFKP